jgi:hypothetical protein
MILRLQHVLETPFNPDGPRVPLVVIDKDDRVVGGVLALPMADHPAGAIDPATVKLQRWVDIGWLLKPDTHGRSMNDLMGSAISAKLYQPGTRLPDGTKAQQVCWWVEAKLLDTKPGECKTLGDELPILVLKQPKMFYLAFSHGVRDAKGTVCIDGVGVYFINRP